MDGSFALGWQTMLGDAGQIALAYILALPIGWDREKSGRSAGLRTFPIVCVAACGFVMLGGVPGASPDSYSRILQGLITGIGFIGGGAILKDKAGVTGTATAASIWNMGIVGAAVGLDLYHIAVVLTLINVLTLKLLSSVKRQLEHDRRPDEELD